MKPRGKRYISPARRLNSKSKKTKSKRTSNSKKRGRPITISNSYGEKVILSFLTKKGIKFIREKTFPKCKNPLTNQKLRFDFYLPKSKICIEFDGRQHFEPNTELYGSTAEHELRLLQYRDSIKTQFCEDNDLTLIRYNYTQYKTLYKLLEEEFHKFC